MTSRLDRLRAEIEAPFLVTNAVNVRYLTGFESSNPALLVEPERVRLFSDFRYAEAGRAVEDVEFEADFVTYAGYETLTGGGLELVPRRGVVAALRAVKDEGELATIGRAAEITNEAFEQLADERFVGRTERELAWRMQELFHELGADGLAFPIIVAAGENGARPHTTPGDRRIEARQTVVIDAGCRVDGYCSDCTRTFATGPLPDELKEAYRVCAEAQLAGLDAVRAGAGCKAADGAARAVVEGAGLGERFGHGLGHGVGLDVHEAPRLSQLADDEDKLATGNVVTVEPGVYLPGVGGIRIEDLVVVTDAEPVILTGFRKDLVTVD